MATKLTLIDISSGFKGTDIQTNFTSIEDEFDKVVYRDGTSPNQLTDDLDANSNRIVNLANAVNNSDAATLADVQAQTTEDATSKPATAITVSDSSGYFAGANVEAVFKELIDTPLTFTADHTFSGAITLSGSLSGTFGGNPTLSGNPNFTGTPTKSGSEIVSSGGGDFPNVNADVTVTDEDLNRTSTTEQWERIETKTPSGASEVDFTGLNKSSYSRYKIVIRDLQRSATSRLFARWSSDNGTSFDSGATDYGWGYINTSLDTSSTNTSDSEIELATTINPSNNYFGEILIEFLGDDAASNEFGHARVRWEIMYTLAVVLGAGERNTNTEMNAFRIFPESGNITGTLILYGWRDGS